MGRHLLFCGFAIIALSCSVASAAVVDDRDLDDLTDTSAVALGQPEDDLVDSYLLSDASTKRVTEPLSVQDTTVDTMTIAEPGTLGLVALAGLMGGAVAMRRRLG
ncbi:PEP-CTERM sorting domain-containing protein [Aeoliella mucimassa]|nr:PEP-CTERM sorting domain-containing protein [Aeoliella mucimassa]